MLTPINVTIKRRIGASVETVWTCLTDPVLIEQWFFAVDFKPAVGHRFRITGDAIPGWRGWTDVEILELAAPRRMVWAFDCADDARPSRVTFTLAEDGPFVRFTLDHEGEVPAATRRLLDRGWTLYTEALAQLAAGRGG